ncbi:MAG: ATP-dependent DNA ligase, partial [Verrucomicrobiae bacterium]|nr:ATP-dependent DNA ligase [Verrucomicrobiae bacterium]
LEDGEIPVFLGYSLGKAQELILAIHDAAPELKFQLYPTVAKMTELVATLGYDFPEFTEFDPKEREPDGHVVIMPPAAGRGQAVRKLKRARTAVATGWALDSGARYRYQVDEAFPLSDHAGYDDLIAYVEQTQPKRVLTLHGYAREFAADLRNRGIEAWSISGNDQIELTLEIESPAIEKTTTPEAPGSHRPDGEFSDFVKTCESVGATTGKLRKKEILSRWLGTLPLDSLELAARFLTGRPWNRKGNVRSAQVGWAVIRRALLQISGLNSAEYRALSASQADAGRTAHLALQGKTTPKKPWTLAEESAFFDELATARGPAAKQDLLVDHLSRHHHVDAGFVVRLLTSDLRIGLKEGLLEEALAEAFDTTLADIREAHMLTGDLGETARLAAAGEMEQAEVRPFTPLRVMLASPEETGEAIWERLAGESDNASIWLEDKFDGIRAQLHRVGDRVEIFSRDLRPLHQEFNELVAPARDLDADVILDGEIIAYAEGKRLTFFDLQKRLGRRREGDLFFGEAVPVRFVAFDLLWADGDSYLRRPLSERRDRLEKLSLPESIERVAVHRADTADAIESEFVEARRRENEGLIAKDPASLYLPGRRGKSWLKLKKAAATLDVVVVKAEQGHGKRSHVLSDYTFSVRDETTGELRVIGKAYSGLTDVEIEELTEHFESHTIEKTRRARIVEPDTVLEIAFDSIQPSKRHDSGLSLRFPRIKAIRRDKTPEEIDTLAFAQRLAGIRK